MLDLEEYWAKTTGLKDVPPDARKEWEERVIPILESPSRKCESKLEAEELVNRWLLRGCFHILGKLGSKVESLASKLNDLGAKLEKQCAAVSQREKGTLEEIREGIDRIEGRLEQPAIQVGKSVNNVELREIKEQNSTILQILGETTEKRSEEPKRRIFDKMRRNWRILAVCGLAVLFLMMSSAWVGWQIRVNQESVWTESPQKSSAAKK